MFDKNSILRGAVSPYEQYCDGYGVAGSSGNSYVLGLVLSTGKAPIDLSHPGSNILDSINAYDRAEAAGPYIGQINMTMVSSFCGINGLIWGYDLAKHPRLRKEMNSLSVINRKNGESVKIYSADPLIDATARLFGTLEHKRFPLAPGSHVPFAGRFITKNGPAVLYCAIAIGIAEDRSCYANLLMEDVGDFGLTIGGQEGASAEKRILTNAARSVLAIEENQKSRFKEIYVSLRRLKIGVGEVGCVLVAAPYFTLAKEALPKDHKTLLNKGIGHWEAEVSKHFLYHSQDS